MSNSHLTDRDAPVYARVSHASQGSIPGQINWAKGYGKANDFSIVWDGGAGRPFYDDGLSGDDSNRPGLARLVALFRERHAAGRPLRRLIVWHLNRISRSDALDTFALYAELRRYGLRWIHTRDRTVDLHNAMDRTLLGIEQDHQSNPFLKSVATSALSGMVDVVKAGYWVGRVPLGYKLEAAGPRYEEAATGDDRKKRRRRSGRLVIDPATGPLIVELFRRYSEGGSTTDLAAWLTTQVKPRRARAWCAQTVRQLLLNEVYVGTVVFGKRAQGKHAWLTDGDGGISTDHDAGRVRGAIVLRGAAPAIVDEATFAVCRGRLAKGRSRGRAKDRLPLPLAGLGRCGHCGGPLMAPNAYLPYSKRQTPRLACANATRYQRGKAGNCPHGTTSTPHDPVLTEVLRLIGEEVLAGDFPERVTRDVEGHAAERLARQRKERANLEGRVGELEAALARSAYRLATAPDDMIAALQDGIRQAREELNGLRQRLVALEADRPPEGLPIDPAKVRAFFDACRKAVAVKVDGPQAGALLNRLLCAITENFTLYFKRDRRGRATPDYVEVTLPAWISSALARSVCSSSAAGSSPPRCTPSGHSAGPCPPEPTGHRRGAAATD